MEVEILKDIMSIVLLYLILRHVPHKVIDKANYYKLRACLYLKFTHTHTHKILNEPLKYLQCHQFLISSIIY